MNVSVASFALVAAVALFGGTATQAQDNGQAAPSLQGQGQGQSQGQGQQGGNGAQGKNGQAQGRGPAIDPAEENGIKAFNAATTDDAKIQAGEDFEQKFPNSRYMGAVQGTLVTLYYNKQDWAKFYPEADKALSKNPDNVPVLTLVGWVIPRVYNASDPTEPAKLDQSEKDEKHALELISSMQKPAGLTDDQFNQAKASAAAQAHSGLGMTYFRKNDYQGSSKELESATTETTDVDPADLYILGVDYQKLQRNSDAAAAFGKCAAIPGGLQDTCKKSASALQGSALTPNQ